MEKLPGPPLATRVMQIVSARRESITTCRYECRRNHDFKVVRNNGDEFLDFVQSKLLLTLMPFDGIDPNTV